MWAEEHVLCEVDSEVWEPGWDGGHGSRRFQDWGWSAGVEDGGEGEDVVPEGGNVGYGVGIEVIVCLVT